MDNIIHNTWTHKHAWKQTYTRAHEHTRAHKRDCRHTKLHTRVQRLQKHTNTHAVERLQTVYMEREVK